MHQFTLTPIAVAMTVLCSLACSTASAVVLRHIDTRIGVLGEGATVIGPSLPFGSIHPSPDTQYGDYDGYRPDKPNSRL